MRYVDNPTDSSRYNGVGVSLRALITDAYGLSRGSLIDKLPAWTDTSRFVIEAKSDIATDEALSRLKASDSLSEKRHMIQVLLVERFHLQIHPETRIGNIYELVATPRAAKLMTPVASKVLGNCDRTFSPRGSELQATACPIPILVMYMQGNLTAEVIDHTGLLGMFAFHLKWNPASGEPHNSSGREDSYDDDRYPALADAVREQLGLQLKKTNGPIIFWVIDHVERPTAN